MSLYFCERSDLPPQALHSRFIVRLGDAENHLYLWTCHFGSHATENFRYEGVVTKCIGQMPDLAIPHYDTLRRGCGGCVLLKFVHLSAFGMKADEFAL